MQKQARAMIKEVFGGYSLAKTLFLMETIEIFGTVLLWCGKIKKSHCKPVAPTLKMIS